MFIQVSKNKKKAIKLLYGGQIINDINTINIMITLYLNIVIIPIQVVLFINGM